MMEETSEYFTNLIVEFHTKWKKVSEKEIGEHITLLDNKWRRYCKVNRLTSDSTRNHPIEDSFNYEISGIWKTELKNREKAKSKESGTTPPTLSPNTTKKDD